MLKKLFLTLCVVGIIQSSNVAHAARAASSSHHADAVYTLSPGLMMLGGVFGFSVNSYIGMAPIAGHEFYIGGDVGVGFAFPGGFLMEIALLPTAWYQFALPENNRLRIVTGLSLGPSILVVSGGGFSVSGVAFEVLFRPGFLYQLNPSTLIGGDLKFGILGSLFVFKPQVNFVFSL